ncbi:MAG: RsmE family RNA methyltransferase [Acidimicrobiales bacterium]
MPDAEVPDGRHGPHAFVADLDRPELSADDRHHLSRVLRLRAGDALTVSDGAGSWRACRFGDPLEPAGPVIRTPAPVEPLTVGFALVKGGRPELIVQKLTELGIDRIVPFVASRSVVRWDEARAGRQAERLERVAREAAMQSRRCFLPVVVEPTTFEAAAHEPGVVLAERGGRPPDRATRVVLVGPEGGWTEDERRSVSDHVEFGAQVLRSETAALAVAAVLGALRAGLVGPNASD